MQISTVNRPSIWLKGPVKVPQKEQCGPTPHLPMLELVFDEHSTVVPSRNARPADVAESSVSGTSARQLVRR
jgi:hypothetical protein